MTIIGDLWVAVRPDTTGFDTQLRSKLEAAVGTSGGGLTSMASKVGAGITAGLVVGAVASIKLASTFQSSVASIAANADISSAAAGKIGEAFQTTAGKSIFNVNQMASAFASVAGPLKLLEGHALTAKQALDFMNTSTTLAEASQTDLGTATKTLQGVMTAFQIPVKNAGVASNELFNTSRATGVGIDQLGNTIDRLKARLGVASPSLQDMGTLLVDLQEHGVQGQRGLLVVNSAMNTLFKSAEATGPAIAKTVNSASKSVESSSASLTAAQQRLAEVQQRLGTSGPTLAQQQELVKAQQALAQAQQNVALSTGASTGPANALANAQLRLQDIQQKMASSGGLTIAQQQELANAQEAVQKATDKNTAAQAKLTAAQAGLSPSLSAAVQGAEQLGVHVFNSAGKFAGLGNIIAQVQPKIKGLAQDQQLAALTAIFGAGAAKALITTVDAGPAAWNKATAAVVKANGVHDAAEKQQKTLKYQMELVKATLTDVGVKIGQVLIPKLESLGKVVAGVTQWLEKHKGVATALAITIGTVLAGAVAVFAINMGTKAVGAVEKALKSLGLFGGTVKEQRPAVASLDEVLTALTATLERLIDMLPEVDTELATTGSSFDELAAEVDASLAAIDEAAVASGEAVTVGLGPIGIAVAAIGLLVLYLATHWKQTWHTIMVVVDFVVDKFKKDFDFIKRIFEDVLHWVESHWKLLLGILIAPIAPVIAVWLIFPKQIKRIFDDVVGFVKKIPHEILTAWKDAGNLLLNVGKDIVKGLLKGLEFLSPLYWVLHFKNQIFHFFSDVGHWLLDAGKKLVEGLIKGAIDAPLEGLKKVGHAILGGIKSVFHIFSPSQDTQPLGKSLTDGLVKGLGDSAADKSKFAKALSPMQKALKSELKDLADCAHTGGQAIMFSLAKGIMDGTNWVKVAFAKVGAAVSVGSTPGGGAAKAGKGMDQLKQESLEVEKLSAARLQAIFVATNALETMTGYGQAQARTQANAMISLSRLTATALDALLQRDFSLMIENLVRLEGETASMNANLTERGNVETSMLVQALQIDRLMYGEARQQSMLLRQLIQQNQQGQQQAQANFAKIQTGAAGNSANGAQQQMAALASGLIG